MTQSKAAQVVMDYTQQPLLESLEYLKPRIEGGDPGILVQKDVRIAYYTLMAGLAELLL